MIYYNVYALVDTKQDIYTKIMEMLQNISNNAFTEYFHDDFLLSANYNFDEETKKFLIENKNRIMLLSLNETKQINNPRILSIQNDGNKYICKILATVDDSETVFTLVIKIINNSIKIFQIDIGAIDNETIVRSILDNVYSVVYLQNKMFKSWRENAQRKLSQICT